MQRTISAPAKTNIEMEGKNGSNFVKNRSQIQNDVEIQIEPSFPSSIYHRCFDVYVQFHDPTAALTSQDHDKKVGG